jgi:hypothetical protein
VVTEWCGNSRPVAMKHYLSVTEADYDAAIGEAQSAANALQRVTADDGKVEHDQQNPRGMAYSPGNSDQRMGDEGLEPPTSTV